jgi:integrase/recombinase XerD
LAEAGFSIINRNRIMTGVRFLFRVTLRRHDLAAEIYHLKEPQKLPLSMSPDEAERLLVMAGNLKFHAMLALGAMVAVCGPVRSFDSRPATSTARR